MNAHERNHAEIVKAIDTLSTAVNRIDRTIDAMEWENMRADRDNFSLEVLRLGDELRSVKTTIRTFLHDLDGHNDDHGPLTMTGGMWLQVEAFRKIVSR